MSDQQKKQTNRKKRHSPVCPCREHIKDQTAYYAPFLHKLGQSEERQQRKLIHTCDPCFIRFLGKCACGILNANIKLRKKDYKALKPSKQLLMNFANPHISVKHKRNLLQKQSGGGFPFFSILGGIASSLLANILSPTK